MPIISAIILAEGAPALFIKPDNSVFNQAYTTMPIDEQSALAR